MNDGVTEVHVERLLGQRIRDVEGAVVGRVHEFKVETVDGELVVTEFHIGPAAAIERIGGLALQLPFVSLLPFGQWEYRVNWSLMDLTDPERPRLRCARRELTRCDVGE